jgi:hypothetical protein
MKRTPAPSGLSQAEADWAKAVADVRAAETALREAEDHRLVARRELDTEDEGVDKDVNHPINAKTMVAWVQASGAVCSAAEVLQAAQDRLIAARNKLNEEEQRNNMKTVNRPPTPATTERAPHARRTLPVLPSVAAAMREARAKAPPATGSRMIKWMCSRCRYVAYLATSTHSPGKIVHELRYDRKTKTMLPCGGEFVEIRRGARRTKRPHA